jgi:hypothetical protein
VSSSEAYYYAFIVFEGDSPTISNLMGKVIGGESGQDTGLQGATASVTKTDIKVQRRRRVQSESGDDTGSSTKKAQIVHTIQRSAQDAVADQAKTRWDMCVSAMGIDDADIKAVAKAKILSALDW